MDPLATSSGAGNERCQLCYHFTSIYNPPTRIKLTNQQLSTYLYHENVKGPFLPSTNTSELDPPKLTFTISTEKPLNSNPPIICEECTRQLDKVDKLHQQLESLKKSIDYQVKLITRKRLVQQSILEDDDLQNINKNFAMITPGISMTGASIGKENIYQSLIFLNTICEGITSKAAPSVSSAVPKIIKVQGGHGSSAVIQTEKVPFDVDPLGELEETLEEAATLKMEVDTSAYLQVEMYGESEDNFEEDEEGTAGDTNIQQSGYNAPNNSVTVLNDVVPPKGQNVKGKVNKGGVKKKRCPDCDKLISAGNFALHQRVHSKETPYVCEYCQKGFTQLNTLKRHLTSMHTTEAGNHNYHKCKVCGEGFSFKHGLIKHVVSAHNN